MGWWRSDPPTLGTSKHVLGIRAREELHSALADAVPPGTDCSELRLLDLAQREVTHAFRVRAGFSNHRDGSNGRPEVPRPAPGPSGEGGGARLRVGMAAQIPIVATTSTPGIARNSKKRPASPSHNGSSAGGYSAGKKRKLSASGFAQVRCHSPNPRVRGSPPPVRDSRAHAWARVGGAQRGWALRVGGAYSHTSLVGAVSWCK